MNESKMLETVVKYSPKSFHEFGIVCVDYVYPSELLPEELESSLISWSNRIPLKPLLLIVDDFIYLNGLVENKKIIDKYNDLCTIREFKIIGFFDELII